LAGERTRDLLILFIIPWTNVVSGMVENLHRKKFLPACIGVGGCRLSVCDRDFVE
jgi:hypothetical protein